MGIKKLGIQIFPGISSRLIASFSLIFIMMVLIISWVYLNGIPFTSYDCRIEDQREAIFKGLPMANRSLSVKKISSRDSISNCCLLIVENRTIHMERSLRIHINTDAMLEISPSKVNIINEAINDC